MARLCAVSREKGDLPALNAAAETLRQQAPHADITVLSVRAVPVSSTQIRKNLQIGADCSCLLPENVVKYIEDHRIYKNHSPE